jgi:hypothetical protein
MRSIMEALAAIPEPDGVTLWRVPPMDVCGEPGGLAVRVAYVSGTAGLEGRGERASGLIGVACDKAHDLSWRGPEVYVWPEAGGNLGVTRWSVIALGFIEQEAGDAFDAVCAAVDASATL